MVGTDVNSGTPRFTFGSLELLDGIELVALALGLFGVAEFLKNVNRRFRQTRACAYASACATCCRAAPTCARRRSPSLRGTLIGSLCSLMPGTGPTIASFVAYATEKRLAQDPSRFGNGAIEGVAAPEASTHSSVQGDFIPTMSLGIPGDCVMALLLGALLIQGITPGPQLISEHPDIFWGLIASFWVGNLMLVVLNVPMIGLWVKLLAIPYRYLYPSALFFICIGVYSTNNDLFPGGRDAGDRRRRDTAAPAADSIPRRSCSASSSGRAGGEFPPQRCCCPTAILPIFVERPISALFLALCVVLLAAQVSSAGAASADGVERVRGSAQPSEASRRSARSRRPSGRRLAPRRAAA